MAASLTTRVGENCNCVEDGSILPAIADARVPNKLKIGEVEIDLARQTALRGRKPIHLTAKELAMLRLMAEAQGT